MSKNNHSLVEDFKKVKQNITAAELFSDLVKKPCTSGFKKVQFIVIQYT